MEKSIFRNDKVILVKEYETMKKVGEIFEVANITPTSIVLRDAKTKIAVGAIELSDFDKYFKKPEEMKSYTPWGAIVDPEQNTTAYYRTNGKKVQVRLCEKINNKPIQAEASCNKGDDFNLIFGIRLAFSRAMVKYNKNCISKYSQESKRYEQIINNLMNAANSKQKKS